MEAFQATVIWRVPVAPTVTRTLPGVVGAVLSVGTVTLTAPDAALVLPAASRARTV